MIRLTRQRTGVPPSFRQPRLRTSALALVDIYYSGAASGVFAFKSSAWKPAKAALKRESHGKCAYCEAPTAIVAHGDVEHFRPKSKYWWLALCYDNYLYSCQVCNQSYKGDAFPVGGVALTAPVVPGVKPTGTGLQKLADALVLDATAVTDAHIETLWAIEDADLPHPCIEDPEALFAYEADALNEEIWVRSAGGARANRAVAAAETHLGLNRDELRRERYSSYLALATFQRALQGTLPDATRALLVTEVRRMQATKQPFSGMLRYFARTWGLPGPV